MSEEADRPDDRRAGMGGRSGATLAVLSLAAALGALGDALLRATPWGLNLTLWILAVLVGAGRLARSYGVESIGGRRWALGGVMFFAVAFVWHDSATLQYLNAAGVLVSLSLTSLGARKGLVWLADITDHVTMVAVVLARVCWGSFRLVRDPQVPAAIDSWWRWGIAGARVPLVALPPLALFAWLLAAADPVFGALVSSMLRAVLPDDLGGHILITMACGWFAAGLLSGLLFDQSASPAEALRRPLALRITEVWTTVAVLDVLFLAFVLVQARYFFGGAALVRVVPGLTYAEYARSGFFQLAVVAALVLPLLLVADGLLENQAVATAGHRRRFRVLEGVLVALLFVIMGSAAQRLRLYVSAYGLTELRFYVTAIMAWLAVVFIWFVATVLRGRRAWFAVGALAAAFLTVVILHAINP
ncbi:MAG: DUF4153 domain-containing protein, partial [Candidatus Methylomirabilaceae bacterium]